MVILFSIFLTDQLGSDLLKIFDNLMFSVFPAYRRVSKFINIRKKIKARKIAYDSGGYHFLLGKIKSPPNPYRTMKIYEMLGYGEEDFLIQLDLPPSPHIPKKERIKLIERSAEFYHIMQEKMPVLGVVHGWDYDEIEYSLSLLEGDKIVSAGTYIATSVIATHSAQAEMVLLRVSRRKIFERLVFVSRLLKDYEVFMLGSSNPNMVHLVFLSGNKYTDGGAWRIAASHGVIYLPGDGRYSIGRKAVSKRLKNTNLLRCWHKESPFSDIPFETFYQRLKNNFTYRALWNAWSLKVEESIANEFSTDPDSYYRYLLNRFERNRFWRDVLRFVWSNYSQKYVQTNLEIFLRN